MSPAKLDPDGFIAEFGQRPMIHLGELGVLGADTAMTHCVHVDDSELDVMAAAGCSVEHCPTTALKVSYGVTQIGKIPEMVMRGINVSIGIDGNNASNYADMHRATYLVAGLFKDARMDPQMFPAEKAYEMATLGGARTMLMEDEIGSLEPGKKADVVLHDTDRPEWRPLLNVMNQLVWSADGRGVHTVFVDGTKVVDAGRMTTIDEDTFYGRCQSRRRGHHRPFRPARQVKFPCCSSRRTDPPGRYRSGTLKIEPPNSTQASSSVHSTLAACAITNATAGLPPCMASRSRRRVSRPMHTKASANSHVLRPLSTLPVASTSPSVSTKENSSEVARKPSTNFGKRSQITAAETSGVSAPEAPPRTVHQTDRPKAATPSRASATA